MSPRRHVKVLAHREAAGRLRGELTRRGFIGGALGVGGIALLGACTSGGGAAATGSGQLNMFTWADYTAPDTLEGFRDDNGTTVSLSSFNSNEEMIAKLVAAKGTGGYDIIVPTGQFIPGLVEQELIQQIDLERIPNFSHMAAEFSGLAWDPSNQYSVCKAWGTTGFVYDKTVITRELATWADFIDAAQNEASGATSVLDDPGDLLGIYFWANDIDWNTTEESHYQACEKFLVDELAPHLAAFDSYPGGGAIPQGSFALMQAWNGDARIGILESGEPDRWQWVLAGPRTELWMDTYAIATGAPNPDAAHEFIDYVLDPETSLAEIDWNGYHTGVNGVENAANEAGLEMLDLVFFTPEQLATMSTGEINEFQERRVDIWNKVRASAGR